MAFGKIIPNLTIDGKPANYPVLNERDARGSAGILLLFAISTFFYTLFTGDTLYLMVLVVVFTLEFALRVINPYYAPFYLLTSKLMRKHRPEYTGAIQKRFAWSMGLAMALSMIAIALIFQIKGILPFTFCFVCIGLLWLESAFGYCVGCKMYYGLMKRKIVKQPSVLPACPGGICPMTKPK